MRRVIRSLEDSLAGHVESSAHLNNLNAWTQS
jgi:hypothetical protein